jgi:hypothetical protein
MSWLSDWLRRSKINNRVGEISGTVHFFKNVLTLVSWQEGMLNVFDNHINF